MVTVAINGNCGKLMVTVAMVIVPSTGEYLFTQELSASVKNSFCHFGPKMSSRILGKSREYWSNFSCTYLEPFSGSAILSYYLRR